MVQLRASLESLVLSAWRDRWSEQQWAINLRTALDQDDTELNKLPGLLLRQSMLSEVPNKLMLNYLSVTLTEHICTHVHLLQAITQYNLYHRHLCVEAMLQLIGNVRDRLVSDSSDAFECERICAVCCNTVEWLLQCMVYCIQTRSIALYNQVLTAAAAFAYNPFVAVTLYLHQLNQPDDWKKVSDLLTHISQSIAELPDEMKNDFANFHLKINSISGLINILKVSDFDTVDTHRAVDSAHSTILTFVNVFGSCKLSCEQSSVARSLVYVQNALNVPSVHLVKDVVRGCMFLLLDHMSTHRESSITAFVYLKVPRVLACLLEQGALTKQHIKQALQQLVSLHSLLNSLDAKTRCNSFQCFVEQIKALNLCTEDDLNELVNMRKMSRATFVDASPGGQGAVTLIIKASGTVQTLERTFFQNFDHPEFMKGINKLVQMMSHMITGKSFDYICASSAAVGKLHGFSAKLIQFNETSQASTMSGSAGTGVVPEHSEDGQDKDKEGAPSTTSINHVVRAVMFDLSFLLLSRITSCYTDLHLERSESVFGRWQSEFGVHNRPGQAATEHKTEHWLTPYTENMTGCMNALKQALPFYETADCNWAHVLCSVPAISKQLLTEIQHNTITAEQIKNVLIGLQLDVCSTLLCVIECVNVQPVSLARTQLLNAINTHFVQAHGPQHQPPTQLPVDARAKNAHAERWNFCQNTARALLEMSVGNVGRTQEYTPSYTWLIQCGRRQTPTLAAQAVPDDEQLKQAFAQCIRHTNTSPSILALFERCVRAKHIQRWSNLCIHEMLHVVSTEQMSIACELCVGMALICSDTALTLIQMALKVVDFVLAPSHELYCVAPRGLVLARFLVHSLVLALQLTNEQTDTDCQPPAKMARSQDTTDSAQSCSTADKAIVQMYNRLGAVCEHGQLRPAVYLLSSVLRILADNQTKPAKHMIALLPPHLLCTLIRTEPKLISARVVLALYDLHDRKQRTLTLQNLCLLRQLQAI